MNDLAKMLQQLFVLKHGTTDILSNRENSQLEFKETFNLGSRAKYARSLVSFANNRGGFLVFGVTNEPRRLKGVNVGNFESCDPVKLTEFFNMAFVPELHWEMGVIEVHGVVLGFVYAHEALDKPIVAVSTHSGDIQEGVVYYRYRGQSTAIRYPELRGMLDERLARERKAWIQHLGAIGRAGPTNVGIIDTVRGKLYGAGPPFLIDEGLLRKLKFIRAGQFSDSEGSPTLRVIGDVQPLAGLVSEHPVHVGIHADDLISAFLAQRKLDNAQAAAYLRESVFQSSPFVPVHYFARLSGIEAKEIDEMLKDTKTPSPSLRTRIQKRLIGIDKILPIGSIEDPKPLTKDLDAAVFVSKLQACKREKQKRTLLVAALRKDPGLIGASLDNLNTARLSEAFTHLTKQELRDGKDALLELLLKVFEEQFSTMLPNERSMFRKAVCFCDEGIV
jgi:hypothetical protein